MANTGGIANSLKAEVLSGIHALGTTVVRGGSGADTVKAALYNTSATVGPATTTYSGTGEASGTNYTAGGITVTNATAPSLSGTTGIWTPSGPLVYTNVTIGPVDCVLLYNSTQANRAIEACTFTQQTLVAGTLTLTMPTNDSTNALMRLG